MERTMSEVGQLRSALGMDKSAFARLLCCDARTLTRWEDGATPSGPASAVVAGIGEALKRHEGKADQLIMLIREAVEVGGLSYLVVRLLDSWVRGSERRI
jgi:hypothetical protein